jgi:hypothetical protein
MEHHFLSSPDHFTIEHAMRRAELIGLGVPDCFIEALLATRVASDLTRGPFWRSVWQFLIAFADAVPIMQIGPIVDFLHSVRHERLAVETPAGTVMREPPQPQFSLKGRTPRSLLRMMEDWHRGLAYVCGGLSWKRSGLQPMRVAIPRADPQAPPLQYEFVELIDSEQLRAEGAALHHCVGSYSHRCWRGDSQIWSLRSIRGAHARSMVTIEIDPARRAIIQARGYRNLPAKGQAMALIQQWAARESLHLRI